MENINEGPTCEQIICPRKQIFLLLKDEWSSDFKTQIELLEKKFKEMKGCRFTISDHSKDLLRISILKLKKKWNDARRTLERFYAVHEEWLENNITITNANFNKIESTAPSSSKSGPDESYKIGRPSVDFTSSSERSKRRKVSGLRNSTSTMELAFATEMNLRASGSHAAANVLKDVTTTSPMRAFRYQSAFKLSSRPVPQEISADAALNLIISGKMTKETYNMVRDLTNGNRGTSVYPSYHKILAAKSRCYPPESSMNITETSAEVTLQALLDHTTTRLFEVQSNIIKTLDTSLINNMKLILKWGCDGSSSQQYKQKFYESDSSDAHVFFTSVVPVQMLALDDISDQQVLLQPVTADR